MSPGKELVPPQPVWWGWGGSGRTQEGSPAPIPLLSPQDWAQALEVPLCRSLLYKPNRRVQKQLRQPASRTIAAGLVVTCVGEKRCQQRGKTEEQFRAANASPCPFLRTAPGRELQPGPGPPQLVALGGGSRDLGTGML